MKSVSFILSVSLFSGFLFSMQSDQSSCAALNGFAIANGEISPAVPVTSAELCCQLCSGDPLCLAAVLTNSSCTLFNQTSVVAKPGYTVLLPNQTNPTPAPAPTPPMNGLLAAWPASAGVYQDGTGQAGRYTVSNGVVTDTFTQIQWEQTIGNPNGVPFSGVQSYCASRNTGGYNDWRAPNVVELGTLVDYTSSTAPYMNPTAFPNALVADQWSGSPDIGNSGNSWFVGFNDYGYTYFQSQAATASPVRCVRSGYPIPPSNRYAVANGIVTDTVTGLLWQQHAPQTSYDQSDAASYCSTLSLGNYNDWRLPTVRELQTLVDYSQPYGFLMMDSTVFAGEPANWFWSSSPVVGSSLGWLLSFGYGRVYDNPTSDSVYVRCLR